MVLDGGRFEMVVNSCLEGDCRECGSWFHRVEKKEELISGGDPGFR